MSASDTASRIRQLAEPLATLEGAALPMLHAVQAEFGHIPADAVPVLAELLNRSRAEMHGLISFYHDFRRRPPGRVVVKLCRAEACQAQGAEKLAADLQAHLNLGWHETTPDGAVTLEPVFCLGLCAAAPCALIAGRPHARLTPARLAAAMAAAA